ncbi:sel1 repeat family protein [Thalassotalea euphylliae]|uniref:Sel1 repeat family protein n=2 Tax=Thalassotalea euphylliae TaxID=1655234 RepID=A0A3E0UJ15_9GAMM|nr:sel1 repeat family protein [Thalassotalea euphylliae]
MMNKLTLASLTLALSLSSLSGVAADLKSGIYELNRGQFKAAMAEFQPLLEEGYAPAQYQVAMMYKNGWGMRKSLQKSYELLSLAADQNYPDAQFELALMYTEGEPVEKNSKKAFELTKKAAEKGLASAQFNLGVMYAEGTGTYRDNRKAVREYEKAAKQNYALAQFNLALMHFEGKGTEKDIIQSYIWNTIASRNGYQPAESSRVLDERKLPVEEIKKAREEADSLYRNLLAQAEIRAKNSQ